MDESPSLLIFLINLHCLIKLVCCQVLQLLLVNSSESASISTSASCGLSLPRLIVVHLYYYNLFEF